MVTWMIDAFGSTEQREKYIPTLATMEVLYIIYNYYEYYFIF
jgi:hypothetical protein